MPIVDGGSDEFPVKSLHFYRIKHVFLKKEKVPHQTRSSLACFCSCWRCPDRTAQNHPNPIIIRDTIKVTTTSVSMASPTIPILPSIRSPQMVVLALTDMSPLPTAAPREWLRTGRYQQRFGYDPEPEEDNDNPLQMLPYRIHPGGTPQPAGYVCGIYGKMAPRRLCAGTFSRWKGFDESVDLGSSPRSQLPTLHPKTTRPMGKEVIH